jgi:APA family basic amino acid/polyamine antiporter
VNNDKNRPGLRRSLRTSDGVALLLGITIGSGIYSTPSLIAQSFHSYGAVIVTWIVVGVFVMVGGLIYAELGTRLPETGGEYIYITRCFGPFAGFLFGWAQLFIIRTSPAAGLAIIASDYIGFFVPLDRTGRTLTAIAVLIAIGVFNYVGVESASFFQKVTTVIKVAGLVLFAVLFAVLLSGEQSLLGTRVEDVPSQSLLGNLIPALMLIVFTHTGWDRVGYVAGEMEDPRKTIPRSMLIGMSIVLAIYWTVVTIYHSALGMEGLRATTTPAADVATLMVGPVGAGIIAALAIVSAVGSINGTTLSATRVYYAMARDGLFFRSLDYVHPRFRTPSRAIAAHIAWAIVILLVRGSFASIAAGMVFAILIFYSLTTLALFKLRREGVGGDNAYEMPLYPWLPLLYLIGIVSLLGFRAVFEWRASLIDLAFLASGLPASLFWLRKRGQPEAPV